MEELIAQQNLPQNETVDFINDTLASENFSRRMFRTALLIDKYYTPLLCLVGTLGNFLSLAVFCLDQKYQSQSASFYLSALALSDTGFLLSLFAVWLEGVVPEGGILTSSDFSCSLVMYLGQVTCFLSVYLTVAFSFERYVAVHYPFSRPRICTRAKARKTVACLTVAALLIFSYAWVIAKVVKFPLTITSDFDETVTNYDVNNSHDQSQRMQTAGNITQNGFHSEDASVELQNETLINNVRTWHKSNLKPLKENDEFIQKMSSDTDLASQNNFSENNKWQHKRIFGEVSFKLNGSLSERWNSSNEAYSFNHEKSSESDYGKYFCSVPEEYFKVSEIANYFDTAVTLIIPFFLIIFFNIQIATCVWRLKGQRQSIVATPSNDSCRYVAKSHTNIGMTRLSKGRVVYRPPSRNPLSQKHIDREQDNNVASCRSGKFPNGCEKLHEGENSSMSRKNWEQVTQPLMTSRLRITLSVSNERSASVSLSKCHYTSPEVRVTKTLLLVSSVFLVLNLPSHVIRCAQFIQAVTGTIEGQELLRALQPWTNMLFNTNFAVNFLLYCLSGKNFRSSLRNLIRRKFKQRGLPYRRRKAIKGRLSAPSHCCSSTLTTRMRESCATNYLHIELGNGDDSFLNACSLNYVDEEMDQIVSV